MKFALVAVLAVACLVAVSADVVAVPLHFSNGVDIEGSLNGLKGISCTVKDIMKTFIDDLNSCPGVASQEVQKLISASKLVISGADDIINTKDEACLNFYASEQCLVKISLDTLELYRKIKDVSSLIPDARKNADPCVQKALSSLPLAFKNLMSNIKTCSGSKN